MTTPDYPRRSTTYGAYTDTSGLETGGTSAGPQSVSDAAGQVAGTAQDEARNVAASAGEQATNVASEARDQTRNLVNQTMSEARSQTDTQMSRIGGKVRELASDLQQMASQSEQHGPAAHVVGDIASRGSDVADWLEAHGPEDVVGSVRRYARRSPVGFLVAAAGAGLVVGRLARAMQAGAPRSGGSSQQYRSAQPYGGTTQYGGTAQYGGAQYGGTQPYVAADTTYARPATSGGETYPASTGTAPSPYAPGEATTDPYLGDETERPGEGW